MRAPLNRRRKIQLIMDAGQRGLQPFLRQTLLCLADSAVRQRHLVFRIGADKVLAQHFTPPPELSFREVKSWDGLSKVVQARLTDLQEGIDWGEQNWFEKGWRLWIAERGDQLIALGWWRNPSQARDFFCPLPETSELLWHVTVMPEFQGHGLQVPLWLSLMHERITDGRTTFYTNCRDYNTPSRRNIERVGFQCIGYYMINKITGRRRFRHLPSSAGI